MIKEFETNLRLQNKLVDINAKSKFYGLDDFKENKNSLLGFEANFSMISDFGKRKDYK